MVKIYPINCFTDNYIWCLVNSETLEACVVDPGDAAPVIEYFIHNGLKLSAILITHHHQDHTGGVNDILNKWPSPVYGPKNCHQGITNELSSADKINIASIGVEFVIIEVPGHTLDHIAYYGAGMLFCGDTLFSSGCGRVFEGTHEQMFASLQKLKSLPIDTKVYCAHEYTEQNLKFAAHLMPNNPDISNRAKEVIELRSKNLPSVPTTLGQELLYNPFLMANNLVNFSKYRTLKDSF